MVHPTQAQPDGAASAAPQSPDPSRPDGQAAEDLSLIVQQLRTAQTDFIVAEIQHLRELAILNRMSDALTLRRDHQKIILDTVREALRIAPSDGVWVIEPDAHAKIVAVHTLHAPAPDPSALPSEVLDLFFRIVTELPKHPLVMPTYNPDAPQGMYTALALTTAEYLLGALVLYSADAQRAVSSEQIRLLQSMLRQAGIACENARLFETISDMIVDVVLAMALAIESRDPYTGGHVLRVTAYSLMLGEKTGLEPQELAALRLGGVLHDIGKIAVLDQILRKPGKLTAEEFNAMKAHSTVGHHIISPILQLSCCAGFVRNHHERWDGRGYPDGLAGRHIPVAARIGAIADTYDAMTSDRAYRKSLSSDIAYAEIRRCAGSQFDPKLAEAFVAEPPQRLAEYVERVHDWRSRRQRTSALDLMTLLHLDRPRTSGAEPAPYVVAA
jgi:HD-GYP domain-containing protein (c-di-GMP phosphodiesterase class II)